MSHLEDDLRAVLNQRAASVAASPERRASTLGRARNRRRLTAAGGLVAVIAVVAGTFALVKGPLAEENALDPAGDGRDSYAVTSSPGEGDVIARGAFRDATWVLRGEREPMQHGQDGIRLVLGIENAKGDSFETDSVVLAGDDVLHMADAMPDVLGDDAAVVFGATTPGVDSLAVDFRLRDYPRRTIIPHRFTDYRPSGAIAADYFIAFVPRLDLMWVAARNEVGVDLDVETINVDPATAPQIVSGRAIEPGQEFNEGIWWVEWVDRGAACLVFRPNGLMHCFSRSEIAEAGPGLLVAEFDTKNILGIAAVLGEGTDAVRVELDNGRSAVVPPVQPPQEELDEWPLRIVVVGVEPGTSGRLETIGRVSQTYDF